MFMITLCTHGMVISAPFRVSAAGVAFTGLVALISGGAVASQAQSPSASPPSIALSGAQSAAPAQPLAAPDANLVPASAPRVIMVIRHGEKPAKGHSLTARGWSRASALPNLFAPLDGGVRDGGVQDGGAREGLPAPKVIYAAGATDGGTGQRTRETVSSLSSRLNVPINTAYGKGQEASLVRQATAQAQNGPVLICWQHGEIPAIASALKVVGPPPPRFWPGNRFDMVWKFTETPQGWTFEEVPEMLLPGDRGGGLG